LRAHNQRPAVPESPGGQVGQAEAGGLQRKTGVREYLSSILVAVGLALLIRTTVVQAFFIPSGSMEDTLYVGDYLLANKFVYGAPIDIIGTSITLFRLPALRNPAPGDIVIFRSPIEEDKDLIKRCVAVGGQQVEVVGKELYVNGERFPDPPGAKFVKGGSDRYGPIIVPKDHYFMMGDNRDNSLDSRVFGPVPNELVKGKAMSVYWSIKPDKCTRFNRVDCTPDFAGLSSLPNLVGTFLWRLPGRVRYSHLGDVIL
jgi:signal peptidase I